MTHTYHIAMITLTFFKSLSGSASWSAAFRFSVDTSFALSFSVIKICKERGMRDEISKCFFLFSSRLSEGINDYKFSSEYTIKISI